MSRLCLFAGLACLVAVAGFASADTLTYAVSSTGQFGTLDLDTGAFAPVGPLASHGYNGIGNLADGTLVGTDGDNRFLQIDATTGVFTVIGPTGIIVETNASLLTGEQFAIDPLNNLYEIDPSTGAASFVGLSGLPPLDPSTFANAFAGDDAGNLYYVFEQGGQNPVPSTLFVIDPTSGAATAIGPTGATGIVGAGFAAGTLYAYTLTHHILTIDVTTGTATDTGVSDHSTGLIFGSNPGGP
jgi:hypothetical protein